MIIQDSTSFKVTTAVNPWTTWGWWDHSPLKLKFCILLVLSSLLGPITDRKINGSNKEAYLTFFSFFFLPFCVPPWFLNLQKLKDREEDMLISKGSICTWLLATVRASFIFSRRACYFKLTSSCVGTSVDTAPIAKDLSHAVFLIWVIHSPYHFLLPQSISLAIYVQAF